jgi:hypothetical protein
VNAGLITAALVSLIAASVHASSAETDGVINPTAVDDPPKLILEYKVRLLGFPVGARSVIEVAHNASSHVVANRLSGFLFNNEHNSEFTMAECDFRQIRYANSGNVLRWKFNDYVEFDWNLKVISYTGDQDEARFEFTDEIFVDKLSQYGVIGCHLLDERDNFILSYVDNTVAHYQFEVIGNETVSTPVKDFETVLLTSTPLKSTEETIHKPVRYWLAPELGYYPVRIRSKIMGLTLTVSLQSITDAVAH